MISGHQERRRNAMGWSTVASALFHVLALSLLFAAFAHTIRYGDIQGERVAETTSLSIETRRTPAPARPRRLERVPIRVAPPRPQQDRHDSRPALHELAKDWPQAAAQPPRSTAISSLQRDRSTFAREVAQLSHQDDPHAIATIDPATAPSLSKSYAFNAGGTQSQGNGVITPIQGWHERGLDCYYARYSYTYPSGASEEGNIVWPACYDPGSDPFHEPPHPMPFPLPQAGYSLPPGTMLPPLEKQAYEEWVAGAPGR